MSARACLKSWRPDRQRGTALVTAILIVALVAALSVRYATDYRLGLARAEARWHGVQARAYMQGAESLAMRLLAEDDPTVDALFEDWAQPLPPFEVEGGWIMASIEDARARFNINNLLNPLDPEKAHSDPTRFSEDQRRFLRLLQSFDGEYPIAEDQAIALLEAIVDWMDPDNNVTGFGGAEADYYQSQDPPYLPANHYFMSVDELRLVRHMTPQLMQLLRPYLVVLPQGQGMNVNTMPQRLLRTINSADQLQPLTEMQVQLLLQDWPMEGFFQEVQGFTGLQSWSSILASTGNLDVNGLTVNTAYFLVLLQVSLVEQRRSLELLLERSQTNEFRVIRRSDVY